MTTKTISHNNRIISYNIAGTGNPVLLLHGFGEDSTVWQQQVDVLQKHYQIIFLDVPGSGASELTDDVSMEGIANVIKEIADAEELDQFVLIGHSMGGYATLAFAEKFEAMLKGFGLVHSSAFADTEEKKETRQKGIEFIKQHGAAEFLKTSTPNLFSDHTKETRPELLQNFLQQLPEFSKQALIAYYEAMMERPDRSAILSGTKLPVLFIIGEHDKAVPFEDSLKQSSFPSISYVTILNKSGHMGMLEETEKCNAAILNYLAEVYKSESLTD